MKTISFEGVDHEFPDDASPEEISAALNAMHPAPTPKLGDVGKSDLAFSSPGADASAVALDRAGKPTRPNGIGGANLVQSILPRTSAIDAGGPGNRPAAYAVDLLSAPGRALASLPQALHGGADGVFQGMQDTHGEHFAGKVLRNPATGAMALAAPFTGGLSLLPASAIAGAAGAAASQADNLAQGKDVSLPQMVGETAINTAAGYGLGKLLPPAISAVKTGASKALDLALEKPATQSLLGKLGYNPELMANSIPDAAGLGAEANAPQIVAQKLKAYDLLHPPEKANVNLQAGLQKYGDAIDKIVQKGTEADVRVNPQAVLDAFAKRRAQLLNQTGKGSTSFTDLVRNAIPKIQAAVNKLRPDETGTVPLEKGVNFRRDLQDMVNNWGDGPNKGLIQDVAKELQSEMNVEIRGSHPIYGPQLDKLNGKYSDLMDMAPMIEDAAKAAFTKSATGTNGIEIPHTRYGVVGKLINAPRVTAMDLMPGVADRIANRAGVSAVPEDVIPSITPPSTVTPEDLQALRGSAPSAPADALSPRGVTGRPALDKPPTFVPGPPVPRAFGPATPPEAPAPDPMADLYPTNRNPALEALQGAPGVEGMMSPEDAAAQPADIRASWEAAIRQARPVRVPPLPEPAGGVQVINPQDLPLSPRTPRGNVQPNGFPRLQESDAIRQVLDNANRRPLAANQPNQETIDALKKLLKQDLPKARKQEILKLISDEIHKSNLRSFGEGP